MIICRVVGRRARPARLGMPLLEQYWRNQISQTLFGWRMPYAINDEIIKTPVEYAVDANGGLAATGTKVAASPATSTPDGNAPVAAAATSPAAAA